MFLKACFSQVTALDTMQLEPHAMQGT